MRNHCVLIGITIIVLLAMEPALAGKTAKTPVGKLIAYSTKNNDFDLSDTPKGLQSSVPQNVARRIADIAQRAYSKQSQFAGEVRQATQPLRAYYGPIFLVKGLPEPLALYIFKLKMPFGGSFYYLIVYNEQTGAATAECPYINGKWMNSIDRDHLEILRRPYVSFDDIDQDGKSEIVIEEQVHNGTAYNAALYRYYQVQNDLSLRQIMAVETRLIDPWHEKESGWIVRTVEKTKPGQIRLHASLQGMNEKIPGKVLGYFDLEIKQTGEPFTLIQRHVNNERYSKFLITGSDVPEQQFLEEGYRFCY